MLDTRGFDAVGVHGGWEHRLANDRIIDQEEQIRSRTSKLVARDTAGLGLKVVPRRGSVTPEAFGIHGAKPFDDRALNRVMQSQPLRGGLHKGEPAQCVE